MSMYQYAAKVIDVHDGDTCHLTVDLGCDVYIRMTVRLAGINAPELSTAAGKVSRDYLKGVLAVGRDVWIATLKDKKEKYGRYLAYIYLDRDSMEHSVLGSSVNEVIVAQGLAVPYMT